MKPLLLDLENIGPFVKKTTVDFSRFGDNALFLITGKTGSGKSFLFDSICYALFGDTPSGREDNLASDFKKTGDKPRILFRFSIGEDKYEVERILEHTDNKDRGSGTTTRAEKQTLKKLSPKVEVLATKKIEVNKKCEELLQLKMDQFARVIMIPQGEFRELLKVNTDDRERLLRQLFRSYAYLDIARALEDEFKSRNGRYLDMKKETGVVLDQLMKRLPPEEVPAEGGIGIDTIVKHKNVIEGAISPLKERIVSVSAIYDKARSISLWMESVINLDRARSELNGEERSLQEKGTTDIDPLKERIRRHELAFEFAPILKLISEKGTHIARSNESLSANNSDLEKKTRILSELDNERKLIPELRARHSLILSNQGRIGDLQADVQKEKALKKSLLKKAKDVKNSVEEIAGMTSKNDIINKDLEQVHKEVQDRSQSLTDIEVSNSRQVVIQDLIRVLKDRSEQVPILKGASERSTKMTQISSHLLVEYTELKRSREGALAYELTSGLVPGHPCPVCGSTKHPTLASAPEKVITKDEVDAAEEAYRRSRSDLDELQTALSAVRTKIEGYDDRIGQMVSSYPALSGLDVQALSMEQESLKRLIASEKKRTSDISRLQKDLFELTGRQRDLLNERASATASLEGLKGEIATFKVQLTEIGERISRNTSEVSSLFPKGTDLATAVPLLKDELERIPLRIIRIEDDYKQASDAVLELRSRISQIRSEIDNTGAEILGLKEDLEISLKDPRYSMFGSGVEIEGSIIDPSDLKKIKLDVEKFDSDLSKLKGRIEQTEKDLSDKLEGRPAPTSENLIAQKITEGSRKVELDAEKERLSSLQHEVKEIETSLKRIEDVAKAMTEMEPDLAILRDLSDQVKGNGRPKISLERFFLAQRFEEVLLEANTRLRKLSEGRFDLKREDEKMTGGGAKSGLDIIVCDNITGTERPANTLSGGQMFLTSLALALGLADVVQARSGGIRMDALFIDEGFGSLDEETLQISLKVLSELRRGRMVGVISHVQDLKRQIPQRIEVTAGRDGSTLQIIT